MNKLASKDHGGSQFTVVNDKTWAPAFFFISGSPPGAARYISLEKRAGLIGIHDVSIPFQKRECGLEGGFLFYSSLHGRNPVRINPFQTHTLDILYSAQHEGVESEKPTHKA